MIAFPENEPVPTPFPISAFMPTISRLPWTVHHQKFDAPWIKDANGNQVAMVFDHRDADAIVEWSRLGAPADIAAALAEAEELKAEQDTK